MDQTIGGARPPKFVAPPQFKPTISEKATISNNWEDQHKLTYLPTFLEGAAIIWYAFYIGDPLNAQKKWQNVKTDFINHFAKDTAKSRQK